MLLCRLFLSLQLHLTLGPRSGFSGISPTSTQRVALGPSQLEQPRELCVVFLQGPAAPWQLQHLHSGECGGGGTWVSHPVPALGAWPATLSAALQSPATAPALWDCPHSCGVPPVPAAPQPAVPWPHRWHPCSLAASPQFAPRWHRRFLSAPSLAAGTSESQTQDLGPLGGARAWPQSSDSHLGLLAGTSGPFSRCGSSALLWVKSCQAQGCAGGVGAELEMGLQRLGQLGWSLEEGSAGRTRCGAAWGLLQHSQQDLGSRRPVPAPAEGLLSWRVLAGAGRGLLSLVVSVQEFLLCSLGEAAAVRAAFAVLQTNRLTL